jgi:hypothetical protein
LAKVNNAVINCSTVVIYHGILSLENVGASVNYYCIFMIFAPGYQICTKMHKHPKVRKVSGASLIIEFSAFWVFKVEMSKSVFEYTMPRRPVQ